MENFIDSYFKAEKNGAAVLILVGVLALGFGLYCIFKTSHPTFRGIGYPLAILALVQLTIGSAVFFRTDAQVQHLQDQYQQQKDDFTRAESQRMERIMRNFTIVQIVEIAFILIGIALILFVRAQQMWIGIGIGLLLQASFLLSFDKLAEERGEVYYHAIRAPSSPR